MRVTRVFKRLRLIREAFEHQSAGRTSEAEEICNRLLIADPADAAALHLLGAIRRRDGQYQESIDLISRALAHDPDLVGAHNDLGEAYRAINDFTRARACYERAIALDPLDAEAHNNLGFAHALEHNLEQAERCFKSAASLSPGWAVARFNLGLALKKRALFDKASKEFRAAWLADPSVGSSIAEMVNSIAELVRIAPDYESPRLRAVSKAQTSFSIIFCSIDAEKCERTISLYSRLLAGWPHEIIPIRDAKSLAEAYNRAIALSKGDIIVVSHDDIDILAPDFASRLNTHLSQFDAVGVIGGTEMSGPAWCWSRHPHLRGWITHHALHDHNWEVSVVDPRPVAGKVSVLDGVFLAAPRRLFQAVNFDEETFDGFHLYDTDWSFRAAQAGYRLAAAGDLLVVHESRGRYDTSWAKYAEKFCEKYSLSTLSPPPPAQLVCASLNSKAEVRSFFSRLADMDE